MTDYSAESLYKNFFESQLLKAESIAHRFFTRNGGVSIGRFSSLNFYDTAQVVSRNKEIIASSFGLEKGAIKLVHQVHGKTVLTIDNSNHALDVCEVQADAMVTDIPNIVLGILTADCCPVLFLDPITKVIGAAHAGWRGAFAGVIASTIESMEKLGAQRSNIKVAIGPAIMWDFYEVDGAFKDQFIEQSEQNARFFKPSKQPTHHMFDLEGYVEQRLGDAGVAKVENLELDTYSMEDNFFSCRRAYHRGENGFGNQMSAICLQKL